MNEQKRRYKSLSCLLLLAVYVSFLCFQVSYNLDMARQIRAIVCKAKGDNVSAGFSVQKKAATGLAKGLPRPSKRFHPMISFAVPALYHQEIEKFPQEGRCSIYFAQRSIPSIIQVTTQLRGPPAAA
jgi:hypothetical protein